MNKEENFFLTFSTFVVICSTDIEIITHMQPPKISDSEWEIMNVVWEKSPITTAELITRLPTKKWKMTTVKTFLDRLVQKGVLTFQMQGGRYLYSPKSPKEVYVQSKSQSFLERIFGGSTAPMLVQFVKDSKLSPEEIRELKNVLREKEKKHGKSH